MTPRRWFLVDTTHTEAPTYLGVAETEAAIRSARHVTLKTAAPRRRIISAPVRGQRDWTAVAEGLA